MALPGLLRTHNCGELRLSHVGETVSLCGWVNKSRDLGGLHFKDIRDKFGMTQLNFEDYKGDVYASLESTIRVTGEVRKRPDEALNKNMDTGEVEILVKEFAVLSMSDKDNLPFLPHGKIDASEDLKLKYRYLDLRSERLQKILEIRSKAALKTRESLCAEGFTEVETPILYKSTPEGARDYIVPSRVHSGKVYALPQSPQTLKQLLMIGGMDKYFQIVKCFRDEDLRADRQPEFTQIDIECSFATQDYIHNLAEKLIADLFKLDSNFKLEEMKYADAMKLYGSDKPDLRFGLEHLITNDVFENSDFKVFAEMASQGLIKAIFVPESTATFSRKAVDALTDVVKPYGGKGVAWFKVTNEGRSGGISKFISDEMLSSLEIKAKEQGQNPGPGTWFFFGDLKHSVAHACADAVRRHFGNEFNLHCDGYVFKMITEFPLLEYDEEDGRFYACHHPFTHPLPEDLDDFMSGDKEKLKNCRAAAYDVVCNGYELGGGSVRIYQNQVQEKMFEVLGMTKEETEKQFGFFIEALKYGVPPHAGIAFGFDRVTMLLAGTDNIRDVIAFPKTATASDIMSSSPSAPAKSQCEELHFKWLES